MSGMVEMSLDGVMYDVLKRPIVILRRDERILPILVGASEAFAIANGMEKVTMPRPMTHDLLTYVLTGFNSTVECVQVYKLDSGTFYAYLIISQNQNGSSPSEQNLIKIDCRPSDAIALAVRSSCPIYVAEAVLDVAGHERSAETDEGEPEDDDDGPEFE